MSGPSTLRICLAAMAPALTEAASARLRLQDTSETERNCSKPNSKHRDDSKTHLPVDITRTLTVTNNDLKVLGGRKRSKPERRVTHLSHVGSEGPEFDPKVTTITGKARGNLHNLAATVAITFGEPGIVSSNTNTNKTLARLNNPNIIPKSKTGVPVYVTEDFQESNLVSQPIPSLLKIMNQPETGTDKEIVKNTVSDKSDSGELSWVQKSGHEVGSKCEQTALNGVGERRSYDGKDKKPCDEKGDAPLKKYPNSVKRSVHFTEMGIPRAQLQKTQKMGVACTGKDFSHPVSTSILSLEGQLPNFSRLQSTEEDLDAKSRDEARKECARKQAYLERKVDTLLRRLKRMRGKVVEAHSREQLRQFVNFQHRSLQHVAKVMRSEAPGPAELKEHFLSNEEVKSMSTTELVKLVKTYQPLASHLSGHRGVTSSLARFGRPVGGSAPVVIMEPALRSQCSDVSDRLCQRVGTVSAELDSDATASSSGGESGDEEEGTLPVDSVGSRPKATQDLPPLVKRAEWRWATDRASIVSRWTWLQAQVSDLEYRIRQQSQVYRQLLASKGGVVLGDPPSTTDILRRLHGLVHATSQARVLPSDISCGQESEKSSAENVEDGLEVSPCNIQAVMSNVDKQASRLSQSLGNCLSPASSSTSAPPSVMGSPRVASSVSSPGRSPASYVRGYSPSRTVDSSPSVPTDLNLTSRTSDLLHSPNRQQNISSSSSSLLPPPSAPDATCQSARCRPLRSYRKRRILRTIGLHRHSHKAARLSDVRCRCSPPANPCPMCGGRYNNTLPMDAEVMALRERIALVDASFHPVLSFPQDVALPVHCEGLLKSGLWQNKPVAKRSRGSLHTHPHRGTGLLLTDYHFNHKRLQNTVTTTNNNNNNHHHQGKGLTMGTNDTKLVKVSSKRNKKNGITAGSGRQNGRNNSAAASSAASVIKNFSEKIKNKYESKTKSKTTGPKTKPLTPRAKKVKRKTSKIAKEAMRKKKQAELDEEEDLEALYLENDEYDIDGRDGELFGSTGLSASASQSSLKDLGGHFHHRGGRRKVDNSYDINNIVIPLSMATTVPVEQPQYKEIVTPKWRMMPVSEGVDASALNDLTTKLEKTNGVSMSLDQHKTPHPVTPAKDSEASSELGEDTKSVVEEEEVEDLSDERFAMRHLQLELEEKKRFRNFVQYPPLRRNRARSDVSLSAMDSRTPDRGDGIISEENSLSSRPSTPVLMKSLPSSLSQCGGRGNSLEEALGLVQQSRTRTTSMSAHQSASTPWKREHRTGGHAGVENVDTPLEPWPTRFFPLPYDEYEKMVASVPEPEVPHIHHHHDTRASHKMVPAKPTGRLVEFEERETSGGHTLDSTLEDERGIVDSVALSPQSVSASASVSSTAGDDPADLDWMGSADAGALSSNTSSASGSTSSKRGRSRRITDDPSDPEWLGSDLPRKNKNKR